MGVLNGRKLGVIVQKATSCRSSLSLLRVRCWSSERVVISQRESFAWPNGFCIQSSKLHETARNRSSCAPMLRGNFTYRKAVIELPAQARVFVVSPPNSGRGRPRGMLFVACVRATAIGSAHSFHKFGGYEQRPNHIWLCKDFVCCLIACWINARCQRP